MAPPLRGGGGGGVEGGPPLKGRRFLRRRRNPSRFSTEGKQEEQRSFVAKTKFVAEKRELESIRHKRQYKPPITSFSNSPVFSTYFRYLVSPGRVIVSLGRVIVFPHLPLFLRGETDVRIPLPNHHEPAKASRAKKLAVGRNYTAFCGPPVSSTCP